jgi:hypothetical protein
VVLRPVELNASRYPGPQQSHEGWLNYILPVKEIVSVGLVEPRMNAPANLGKNHELNEFIFKKDSLITYILFFKSYAVSEWIRVDLAAASLVNPLLKKHGIGVSILDWVGRNGYLFLPAADFIGCK